MFRQALVILEKTLEPAHPDVAMAQNNLAALYQDQQRYSEAELFYRRALAIQEKAFGQDHPAVTTTTNNLGSMYLYQKKYVQAASLLLVP